MPHEMNETSSDCLFDFAKHDTLYATHGLHPYAAKCPPQLARWAICEFSSEGDVVLDPMAGSGTTLVEARLLGRHGIGVEIDAMASFLARVKSTPISTTGLRPAIGEVLSTATSNLSRWNSAGPSMQNGDCLTYWEVPDFHNRDYWFSPEVTAALWSLKGSIGRVKVSEVQRAFLYLAFSSLILAKNSVANARDIVHSRHHYRRHATPPDALAIFRRKAERMVEAMESFAAECQSYFVRAQVLRGDARRLPLADSSVDMVFTSPPYCTALDYPRAHALGVGWLQDVLNIEHRRYKALGRYYIGAERPMPGPSADGTSQSQALTPGIQAVLSSLESDSTSSSSRKGYIVRRYFEDMARVIEEMARVVRSGRHIVMVVCPSNIRKVAINTHELLAELAESIVTSGGYRLALEHMWARTIADSRRLLPYMRDAFGPRMRTEYVMVFQKRTATRDGVSG